MNHDGRVREKVTKALLKEAIYRSFGRERSWTSYPQEGQTCDVEDREVYGESDDGRRPFQMQVRASFGFATFVLA
jgi:hypothetical protein